MYNTDQLNQLKRQNSHNNEIILQFKEQLLRDIDTINEVKINLACLTLKLSYIKLSNVVHRIMSELRDLINHKFDKDLLTFEVKQEICEGLE